MTKILLLQGANMAYLGKRQPEIYGTTTAAELDQMLQRHAGTKGVKLDIFYTHIEGEAIGRIYRAADEGIDGLLMNPAGFIHAGYALRDCLRAMQFPYVEVHMSNIDKRGLHSVTAETARGMIAGFGLRSYLMGLDALVALIQDAKPAKTRLSAKGNPSSKGKKK
jgi:3-dehydroquinate dehydratase-2